MSKRAHVFFASVMACLIAAVSAMPSRTAGESGASDDTLAIAGIDSLLTPSERGSLDRFFLEALCQKHAGNADSAASLLRRCMEIDSTDAAVNYELALYNMQAGRDTVALNYFEKAARLSPANTTYQESLAMLYIQDKDYDKAIAAYQRIFDNDHERTDVLHILIQLLQQKDDYAGMLEKINTLERLEGSSEDITLSKMRVYELMDDSKSAYKAIKSLAEEHPNDVNYQIMLGNWLLQKNKKKEAYKIFSVQLKENPGNTYAQSSMYDYYMTVNDTLNAHDMRDRLLMSRNTPPSTKMVLVRQIIKENEDAGGDSTKVLSILNRMVEANPKDGNSRELLIGYMTFKRMPEDSITTELRKLLDVAPDMASARLNLLQNLWPHKNWDEIIDLSKAGTQYNPDQMAFYYFLGLAHYQKEEDDNALDAFRRGVSEITQKSDPAIVSDFYAIMGDILQKKGATKESFAAYDSCLQWKPDNISCLNNYAYFLSVADTLLDKAEEMSFKAIKAEPANATYLDTYAWVLFRQKRYAEAQIYIDQSLKNDTDSVVSGVVLEHAGDIYYMNGNYKQAILYWKQAQATDNASELLTKKIEDAMIYEDKKDKQK